MKKPESGKSGAAAKRTRSPKASTAKRANTPLTNEERLREALAPYINLRRLQYLAAYQSDALHQALLTDEAPPELKAILSVLSALLRPVASQPITRAADVAALLMVEMSDLAQEQVRVVCLDSKNHIQTIHTLYQGHLHGTSVRIGELFREALRLNSAAIILVHNHPSGDTMPSPADLAITRDVSSAGKLLSIPLLDHVIIGRGNWLSLGAEYSLFEG
jgi:DNA repair protein RadC